MPDVCITIPVYKPLEGLKPSEHISWKQCLHILGGYTICLIHPPHLVLTGYTQALVAAGVAYTSTAFPAPYFANIAGYNQLLLSRFFFEQFVAYEYMLLYQLDAYVFEDRLPEWCAKGYSFVGAPWFEGFVPPLAEARLWKVGNGGFTLRRIPDCLRVLNSFAVLRSWSVLTHEHLKQYRISDWQTLPRLMKRLLLGNNTHWCFNDYGRYAPDKQEDYFWGVECAERFSWYNVPTPQEALAFSFEVHPYKMYELNNYRLPMGCHAWEKYGPEFWRQFIDYK